MTELEYWKERCLLAEIIAGVLHLDKEENVIKKDPLEKCVEGEIYKGLIFEIGYTLFEVIEHLGQDIYKCKRLADGGVSGVHKNLINKGK